MATSRERITLLQLNKLNQWHDYYRCLFEYAIKKNGLVNGLSWRWAPIMITQMNIQLEAPNRCASEYSLELAQTAAGTDLVYLSFFFK